MGFRKNKEEVNKIAAPDPKPYDFWKGKKAVVGDNTLGNTLFIIDEDENVVRKFEFTDSYKSHLGWHQNYDCAKLAQFLKKIINSGNASLVFKTED